MCQGPGVCWRREGSESARHGLPTSEGLMSRGAQGLTLSALEGQTSTQDMKGGRGSVPVCQGQAQLMLSP